MVLHSRAWVGRAAAALALGLPSSVAAQVISEGNTTIALPGSLFTEVASPRDRDADGLKDDMEARLADVWRPFLEFDEQENNGEISDQPSLLPVEPRTLFQVSLLERTATQSLIEIRYRPIFRMDGGYRGSDSTLRLIGLCKNSHSGDQVSIDYRLRSDHDGVTWHLLEVDGWANERKVSPAGAFSGPNSTIVFERPLPGQGSPQVVQYSTHMGFRAPLPFWPEPEGVSVWPASALASALAGSLRPHVVVLPSAGKHHQYIDNTHCEDWPKTSTCDEDCGGGARRLTDLAPLGYFLNVGQSAAHPQQAGFINQPFVAQLWHLGYPHEFTWFETWKRDDCETPNNAIFTGGMNDGPNATGAWEVTGFSLFSDTCVSPTFSLFK